PERLILVIEDDPLNLEIMSRLLKGQGYSILAAHEAEQGVTLAKEKLPALVLLDIGLVGAKDGIWAARQLKKDETTRHMPVIACTARAMPADMQEATEAGCDDFILKPYEFAAALETVRRHLDR